MADCCSWTDEMGRIYDAGTARMELEAYRAEGPRPNTRSLVDGLAAAGVQGLSLLDIGGGVGMVQHELVAKGVAKVTDVDASRNYLEAARSEAARRGYAARAEYVHGDFAAVAGRVGAADIVTLDRVVCCYPDLDALLGPSADRARRLVGLVLPHDAWYVRAGGALKNGLRRITGNPDRVYIHRLARVEALLAARGFSRRYHRRRLYWQVDAYEKGPRAA